MECSSKHRSITAKKRLTQDQLHLLETSFITNPKLEGESKQELASKLGLPPKQVAIWYQNKRARCKTEAIEHEYKATQLQLQNVLAHNQRLQSEVGRLTHKLNQAHHLLFLASNPSAASASASASTSTSAPSFSVPGSSSLNSPASMNSIWENAEVLPIMEELYACLLE
ncbi:hypothetical protein VitviT2T_017640 [Vitis vinifera]|uniref:Homeobox-leucine zipper protein n=2 Tax=Vitis vinifera TaxID=29760 RepID=A5AFC4_VITVI|nr:homeobox-leucine zipper protein ATHB-52 [Vitis vinifera]RVX09492.1 Homeobox-leucine zipper protein HAT5 [Vitis vinifera]WJZ99174.1 hypothetical protein VitviT2T_017640 [Vitis vinifera]CAN60172.1 hypothetical protein VITISV_003668 [Vitis vinifera]|eukprot:XP_002275340.1 PREDICTED: homeobox-leucine zipper protein ATHB-52 [Vitis vinifera]